MLKNSIKKSLVKIFLDKNSINNRIANGGKPVSTKKIVLLIMFIF